MQAMNDVAKLYLISGVIENMTHATNILSEEMKDIHKIGIIQYNINQAKIEEISAWRDELKRILEDT